MVQNLRKLRIGRGISQQQLAEVIGVSQQSINKYENHNVEPDIRTLSRLADYFETTVDYLVGHTPSPESQDRIAELELTKEEARLVQGYRCLSPAERESIQLILKNYSNHRHAP